MHNQKILFSILAILALFLLLSSATNRHGIRKIQNISKISTQIHNGAEHSICEGTLRPHLCISTLASLFPGDSLNSKSVPQILEAIVNHAVQVSKISASSCTGIKTQVTDPRQKGVLDVCLHLLEDTVVDLEAALLNLQAPNTTEKHHHLHTLFTAAMTNTYTCADGFSDTRRRVPNQIMRKLQTISLLLSSSLAVLEKIPVEKERVQVFPGYGEMVEDTPMWITKRDRRLLQATAKTLRFDLMVAKDGTGNFSTIGQAVAAAPNSSSRRFVIYIKEGVYLENVEVGAKKPMLMFIGDGIGKTVVKANRNMLDGCQTFASATVAVEGDRFIALRSGSDMSAFYRCSFLGYQDTLYVHSHRQFYRDCDVYGTVDFIFGNAAVVFQHCNLFARKPDPRQKNAITAQGKDDVKQNSGISIMNCNVTAAPDLVPFKSSIETYLGRPWKEFSTTAYLRSSLDDVVHPSGWLEWNKDFAKTLTYREFQNQGAGANTAKRVKWAGYKAINSTSEANQYTVDSFIQGSEWLPPSNIPFYPGLDD